MCKKINDIYDEFISESKFIDIPSEKLDDEENKPNTMFEYTKLFAEEVAILKNKQPLLKELDFNVSVLNLSKKIYITFWDWDKSLIFETIPFYGYKEKMYISAKSIIGIKSGKKIYKDKKYNDKLIKFKNYNDVKKQAKLFISIMKVVIINVYKRYDSFLKACYRYEDEDENEKDYINEKWDEIDSDKLDAEENKPLFTQDWYDSIKNYGEYMNSNFTKHYNQTCKDWDFSFKFIDRENFFYFKFVSKHYPIKVMFIPVNRDVYEIQAMYTNSVLGNFNFPDNSQTIMMTAYRSLHYDKSSDPWIHWTYLYPFVPALYKIEDFYRRL